MRDLLILVNVKSPKHPLADVFQLFGIRNIVVHNKLTYIIVIGIFCMHYTCRLPALYRTHILSRGSCRFCNGKTIGKSNGKTIVMLCCTVSGETLRPQHIWLALMVCG